MGKIETAFRKGEDCFDVADSIKDMIEKEINEKHESINGTLKYKTKVKIIITKY